MEVGAIEVRECVAADAECVARLSAELGYPVPVGEMARRVAVVAGDPNHSVLVACLPDGSIAGWIDVGTVFHLQSGSYCEIGGLVVARAARGNGIGRELIARAEQWAVARGLKKVVVRSNAIRADAHRFYLREQYTMMKTSAVFEKKLG